jgi:coenzyme PQQ synthesis protein D (PqqD)
MRPITKNTIFERAQWVVVRPQKGSYLFYNSRTDELHLIPPSGHAAYALCDGLKTVEEIGAQLSEAIEAEPSAISDRLAGFLGDLEARGLVERADA